jgi:SAM-dependent MidA family methyltransferase
VLSTIGRLDAEAFARLTYVIAEPLASLRVIQQTSLAGFRDTVCVIESAAELAADPLPGIAYGNEVLDALPFHVIERHGGGWRECRITADSASGFEWSLTDVPPCLGMFLKRIGDAFPDGYRTEVRTCFTEFLAPLAKALVEPLMIWPDYGFARADLYQPQRTQGTLRTFRSHQAGDDPLAEPGSCDITAHVDFTAVAEAAAELGGHATDFRHQGAWLIENARDWMLSLEGRPDVALVRQFQTLTHPAHLGGVFQVIELSWQPGPPGADAALRHRLFADIHG